MLVRPEWTPNAAVCNEQRCYRLDGLLIRVTQLIDVKQRPNRPRLPRPQDVIEVMSWGALALGGIVWCRCGVLTLLQRLPVSPHLVDKTMVQEKNGVVG